MAYPDHFKNAAEREIIDQIISDALAAGITISVYDGEEWPLKQSTDPEAIKAEVAAIDETYFLFRREGVKVGSVLLVHGNGYDVISDYSNNPETQTLLASAEAVAERLANEAV